MEPYLISLLNQLHLLTPATAVANWFIECSPRYHDFYAQFVKADGLCFDIGANLGNRTAIFRKLGSRVVAVEPQVHCAEHLRKKFGNDTGVTIIAKAAGAAAGQGELFPCTVHQFASMSQGWIGGLTANPDYSYCRWQPATTVDVTTLDQLVSQCGQPDYIKIDAEGYDGTILSGLSRPPRCLSFSFTAEFLEDARLALSQCERLGSPRYNYHLGDSLRWHSAEWLNISQLYARLERFAGTNRCGEIFAQWHTADAAPAVSH